MTTQRIAEDHHLPWHTAPARPGPEPLRSEFEDLEQRARTMIRERPVVAMLLAAGFGFVMARFASRGRR